MFVYAESKQLGVNHTFLCDFKGFQSKGTGIKLKEIFSQVNANRVLKDKNRIHIHGNT